MDTRFSVAVHVLTLISESPDPLNSDRMARSVGTNASYIRKVLALLKRKGIVDCCRGTGGYTLTAAPDQITLLQIYQAVMGEPKTQLLDIHQNPNDRCAVGRHIRPVLTGIFKELEDAFSSALAGKSLADCISGMKKELAAEQTGQA